MRMMHLVVRASLVLTGHSVHLLATCEPPPPLCEGAARADLVFFGEVLDQTLYVEQTETGPLPQGIQAVRFNVLRAFKGVDESQQWRVLLFRRRGELVQEGARYLVFAHRRATGAFVTGCTLTRELNPAEEDSWFRTEAAKLGACFKTQR